MSSRPVEEDKHDKRTPPEKQNAVPTTPGRPEEEIKRSHKEPASPDNDVLQSIQREFEDYKKENEELNMAELSFENPVPHPKHPEEDNKDDPDEEASSSHFSLGAPPIHQSHPNSAAPVQPESVMDRQMSMLMGNLIGLVNKHREELQQKGEKYKKREADLTAYQIEKSGELEREKEEWGKHKKACIQPDNSDLIEINVGGTHTLTTARSTLTKIHNSLLAALFSPGNKLTMYRGKVFIDRDGEPFAKMISFLRNGHMPMFSTKQQEQSFRDELEYWQIPLGQEEIENVGEFLGQFDDHWCADTLRLESENRIVVKQGANHGIVFSKTPLSALCPYISFKVNINARSRGRSNLFVGVVDRTNYTQEHLVSTFWKDSPASFYWDVWSRRLISTDNSGNHTGFVNNYGCTCEGAETEIGILYNSTTRTVNFYKNSIDQGVAFKGVRAELYPALDLWFISGSVEILSSRKPSSKIYL